MNFTKAKNRVWVVYSGYSAWLARRSMPVRKAGYGIFGLALWIAYILPGSNVRATFAALSERAGVASPRRLFRDFVRNFLLGVNRIEQVRHGYTDAIDGMLQIPDKERLDGLLQKGGVLIGVPHTHSTLAMGRGLGQRYPMLALVRSSRNERRRALGRGIYENLGCEFLDVQVESPTLVARKVLKALQEGRLVIGTVDRIRAAPPPECAVDGSSDTIRAMAFGAPIGLQGWPSRFAMKAKVPIIPATVVQTNEHMVLTLGDAVCPEADLVGTTQAWIGELEKLLLAHPDEWAFSLDKHWSRVLRGPQQG